jgi:hypothetical protein
LSTGIAELLSLPFGHLPGPSAATADEEISANNISRRLADRVAPRRTDTDGVVLPMALSRPFPHCARAAWLWTEIAQIGSIEIVLSGDPKNVNRA